MCRFEYIVFDKLIEWILTLMQSFIEINVGYSINVNLGLYIRHIVYDKEFHTCFDERQKFLPFKSCSVVDSLRNPLDINISSVVDWRLIRPENLWPNYSFLNIMLSTELLNYKLALCIETIRYRCSIRK